jgi:hypothetical protein
LADLAEFPEQEEEIKKQAKLAATILEGYFDWLEETGVDAGLTVIAPERKVQIELPNAILQGKIDLLVKRQQDGAILVLDHKSVQAFESTELINLNEQARTYILLKMLDEPKERIDGALWNELRKTGRGPTSKPPYYRRTELRFNRKEMQHFYYRVVKEIDDIIALRATLEDDPNYANVTAYPTPSRDCKWRCDFFGICSMLDTDLSAGGLTETLYKVGDPYRYYLEEEEEQLG